MKKQSYDEALLCLESNFKKKNVDGLEILVKEIPESSTGNRLDPRVLEVTLDMMRNGPVSFEGKSIHEIRSFMGWPNRDLTKKHITIVERSIEGTHGAVPVRVYRPSDEKKLPCLIFFHGGGFFGGTLDAVENPCKFLCEKSNAVVISVDYSLSPEYQFPVGFDDCYDIVRWVYENSLSLNIDKDKIGVGGDSAGGNLAVACALRDRNDQEEKIKFQVLIYPTVDCGKLQPNYDWNLEAYQIDENDDLIKGIVMSLGESTEMLVQLYLGGNREMCANPYVSPIMADTFSNLPDTLIINAEFDYLRLEGEALGKKLMESDVNVKMIRYNGVDHAFMDKLGIYPQSEDLLNEVAKHIRTLIGKMESK